VLNNEMTAHDGLVGGARTACGGGEFTDRERAGSALLLSFSKDPPYIPRRV
jgi:hypothetical protein